MTTRRAVLGALGLLTTGALAGCSAIDSDPKPGSLLVVNNDDSPHTLRLTIKSDGETRQETVDIGAAEWGLRNKLLDEPGTYEVTVALGGSDGDGDGEPATATTTVKVRDVANGGGLGGENLEVYIDQDGSLRAVARQYD